MDIRVLRYFLTVAREESFSRAAQSLFISQPTLSRQIRDMEEELGVELFSRTSRSVTLTRDGMRLRRRAQEIVDLMDRTRDEFAAPSEEIAGEIRIGSGETMLMRRVARIATLLHRDYPGIRYQMYSANADDIIERLDRGILDFGLVINPADIRRFDALPVPGRDVWGILTRSDHPLSQRETISPQDLNDVTLLTSRQSMSGNLLPGWLHEAVERSNVAVEYNLIFNAAIMVEEGMGCALTLEGLVDTSSRPSLCFRPFSPRLETGLTLIWKKYQMLSPAAELFLRRAQDAFRQDDLDNAQDH